jgi:hypothetical protein
MAKDNENVNWIEKLTVAELESSIRNLTYELKLVWRSNDRSKYLAAKCIENQINPLKNELLKRNEIQ